MARRMVFRDAGALAYADVWVSASCSFMLRKEARELTRVGSADMSLVLYNVTWYTCSSWQALSNCDAHYLDCGDHHPKSQ